MIKNTIAVPVKQVEELLAKVLELNAEGRTKYRGMTYEQGIADTIDWLFGDAINPLEDDE